MLDCLPNEPDLHEAFNVIVVEGLELVQELLRAQLLAEQDFVRLRLGLEYLVGLVFYDIDQLAEAVVDA